MHVQTTRHSTASGLFRILHYHVQQSLKEVNTSMTRGKKPEAAIAEAKGFAQRMGYLTMDNRPDDLMFDFLIYKRE